MDNTLNITDEQKKKIIDSICKQIKEKQIADDRKHKLISKRKKCVYDHISAQFCGNWTEITCLRDEDDNKYRKYEYKSDSAICEYCGREIRYKYSIG